MLWAAPLAGQVGIASAGAPIALTARKAAAVGVNIAPGRPIRVATAWAVEPARTAPLSLVAYVDAPERAPGVTRGGPKNRARVGGVSPRAVLLFEQPISPAAPAGARTDDLQVAIDGAAATISLLVITQ